ncbi:MAG: hypothetical protein ACJAQ3_003408, partial [Planctomycetota bacterium]
DDVARVGPAVLLALAVWAGCTVPGRFPHLTSFMTDRVYIACNLQWVRGLRPIRNGR